VAQQANSWSAQLPTNLSSALTLANGSSQIGFTLAGAGSASTNTGTVSGATATYPNAVPGATVSEQVVSSGVKETLSLASAAAPSTYTWDLKLSSGLSAVASADGGVTIDSGGSPLAAIAPPTVTDAAGNVGAASLVLSQDAMSVTVSLDPTWLSAPGRAFPVKVDPTTSYFSQAAGCTLNSGAPNTASCASTDLGVGVSGGSVQRSVVWFQNMSNGTLPVDAQIQQAYLDLPVDTLSGSVTLNAYPLTRAYSTSAVTWNDYDGTHAWTTAGGDYQATPTVSGAVPSSGQFYLNVPTTTAQSWVDGAATNYGFLLKASNESTGTNLADFDPTNGYGDFLDVYWTPNTGVASGYPIVSHTLDDHLSLGVNAANGNLVVHATDLAIQGDAGQKEVVDRYYNSENLSTYGGLGDSWSFGEGSGVYLEVNSDNITVFLPGGQPAVFMDNGSSWTTPPGVDAVLTEPSSGNYSLTYNSSQEVIKFATQTCSTWAVPETSVADRNGETISYAYSATCDPSGIPLLSTITDTEGRVTTVSNNGYFHTGLSDPQTPTARTASYSVSGATTLTSTKDTSGNYTYYTYASGSALLTQIEDPNGNYTEITYDGNGRVHTVTYVTNVSAKTGPTYTYAYTPGTTSSPDGGSTTVQDPNGHTTTYYYSHEDQQTKVTDANGDIEQTHYSPDNQPDKLTDAMSTAGVTTIGYDSSNNATSALEPANGSDTAAKSYTNYQTGSGSSGNAYLPSSSVNAEGQCSYSDYDANGNLKDTYGGEAGVANAGEGGTVPGCSSTSTYSTHTTTKYDGDPSVSCTNAKAGEVCSTIDGDGNTTNYAYDTSGDLASVTPPSPQGATTYTYDSLSRVASVTNGDGNSGTPGTISTVQSATTNYGSSPVSSQTTTLASNTTKGDTVVVVVDTAPVTPVVSVSSISGGGVGTWHLGKASSSTTLGDEEIWYGYANTGGSNSVTVNMSASTSKVGTVVSELTGVASTSPLDVSGSNSGSSSTVITPSLTTTAVGDVVVDAANADNTISSSPSSPWVDYAGPLYSGSAFTPATTRVVSATGAYSTSWGTSSSGAWLSVGIALKPAIETTSYTYDAMDRVTQILYGGDAACIPSSGNCITYTYDADGNVTQRVDNTGTYTFAYDALNRLTDKGTPSGADACSGSSPAGVTYTYDGASNLSTSCDALGTTNYYYDAGNRLTSQVEPGGTSGCAVPSTTEPGCTAYSYDADNHLLITLFPGGAKQTSMWTANGKMSSIIGANSSGTPQTSFVYNYASGTNDQDLVQTRVENDPSVSSATTVTYGYDLNNELMSAVTTGGSSSTLNYYYDAAGNRCSATPVSGACTSGTNYYLQR
jgi:YD repeat-containing protein